MKLCKICQVNPAPNPAYRGLCAPCRTELYAYSKGKTCPDCGKPVNNQATYCRTCSGATKRNRKQCTCEWCGKAFEIKVSQDGRFCSMSCRGKLAISIVNQKRPTRREFTCSWCGVAFRTKRESGQDHYFCSKSCAGNFFKSPEGPRKRPKAILTCEICGKEFERRAVEAEISRTCSVECRHKLQSVIISGKNHPNWKGGAIVYRGPNWYEQRRKALERAHNKCERCGKTKAENGNRLPGIHHVKPFRDFGYIFGVNDNYLIANHLDNLMALCAICHGQVERGVITITARPSYDSQL